jgi:hypothetical protein
MSFYPESYVDKGLVLYLRPVDNVPRYEIRDAAEWFHAQGYFKTVKKAFDYLIILQAENEPGFRNMMDKFYSANSKSYYDALKPIDVEKIIPRRAIEYGPTRQKRLSERPFLSYFKIFGR